MRGNVIRFQLTVAGLLQQPFLAPEWQGVLLQDCYVEKGRGGVFLRSSVIPKRKPSPNIPDNNKLSELGSAAAVGEMTNVPKTPSIWCDGELTSWAPNEERSRAKSV